MRWRAALCTTRGNQCNSDPGGMSRGMKPRAQLDLERIVDAIRDQVDTHLAGRSGRWMVAFAELVIIAADKGVPVSGIHPTVTRLLGRRDGEPLTPDLRPRPPRPPTRSVASAAPRPGQADARHAQLAAAATKIAGRSLGRRMTLAGLADELGLSDGERAALQEAVGWTGEGIKLRKLDDTQTRALASLLRHAALRAPARSPAPARPACRAAPTFADADAHSGRDDEHLRPCRDEKAAPSSSDDARDARYGKPDRTVRQRRERARSCAAPSFSKRPCVMPRSRPAAGTNDPVVRDHLAIASSARLEKL